MFLATANPYDELVAKATDENLASEDWALNMELCDKVSGEGQNGARQAVASLQKRLAHRNPNVQLYALELANSLAQNCDKNLLGELSSRNWTSALDRLINDRATALPVKKKSLRFVKAWAEQFESTGDPNLGLMGELYDQLRANNHIFDEPEPTPETAEELRRRQEDEELQRVLEISKQDKGGRSGYPHQSPAGQPSSSTTYPSTGSSAPTAQAPSQPQIQPPQQNLPNQQLGYIPQPQGMYPPQATQPGYAYPSPSTQPIQSGYSVQPQSGQSAPNGYISQPQPSGPVQTGYAPQPQRIYSPQPLEPELPRLDINTATRVRAIYPFTGQELGELDFERGDIIKVLDRGFKEWWRGACNGKIGIFPVTYVEPLPELSPKELQEEAQEEAKVFASLGLVDQLLQTLKGIDPSRGHRLDDQPEIEEMYQASVALQSQISALIKKYSDQKTELEHMNANFIKAIKQYEELRNGPVYFPNPNPNPNPNMNDPLAHPPREY
ncbi:uncharacterized protein L203_103010 [Cryptococcus depauperatus CBS 7841]|uniref:Class E vacuolar protein-sorting machinery protein HSE1 n=1 Tax=Cryptococcus depauperatus CBS 7841 TaxID=1295531 RepID=A0AAJ8JST3_9TREE